ncbi:MAG: RNA polymerase sigma factor [Alphaproteobacteria bacterium]|nr:RNA polymerase sigma factor [Alphaproteobacteria bacterium]
MPAAATVPGRRRSPQRRPGGGAPPPSGQKNRAGQGGRHIARPGPTLAIRGPQPLPGASVGGLVGAPRVKSEQAAQGAPREPVRIRLIEAYLARRENLVRYLATRCASRSAAEDLAQDLFIKVAAVDPALEVENPAAFVYRMAANLANDHLRRQRRAAEADRAWGVLRLGGASEARVEGPAVDEAVAAQQALTALLARVERLPPRRQQVFRLHRLEGRSRSETARILGISLKAVEKQMTAALKALTWPEAEDAASQGETAKRRRP